MHPVPPGPVPPGATESRAFGAFGSQQVGFTGQEFFTDRAVLWSGTAASIIDLTPPGATSAGAFAIAGAHQYGSATFALRTAAKWTGTAASYVDLHPGPAYDSSQIKAAFGTQQVGIASPLGSPHHAGLWTGTAASFVDLHPAFAFSSQGFATDGVRQGGFIEILPVAHAAMWSGTAASFIDLHPAGAMDSQVRGMAANNGVGVPQQVGFATMGGGTPQAALWTGTAASFVNLNPATSTGSAAYATTGPEQVGFAVIAAQQTAVLWSGSAASYIDLGVIRPPGFTTTQAHAIAYNGSTTYVAGFGFNAFSGRTEALLWIRTPSCDNPSCPPDGDGPVGCRGGPGCQ